MPAKPAKKITPAQRAKNLTATRIAKDVLAKLPEHTFSTGSQGRMLRQSVEIDGQKFFLNVMLTASATVPRDADGKPLSAAAKVAGPVVKATTRKAKATAAKA